jgi:diguanylate cyclase (GGDEF)-like protein
MPAPYSELLRVDPLTGCKNYLGFLETLTANSLPDEPADGHPGFSGPHRGMYRINPSLFSAIIFVDITDLKVLNEAKGRAYGDSVLRWMGILLQEESNSEVYRIGGDEFSVLLKIETRKEHLELIGRILRRMEREARQLGFPGEAADIALIFFDHTPINLDTILVKIGEAITMVKKDRDSHFMIFNATDLHTYPQAPATSNSNSDSDTSVSVRLFQKNIHQVLEMGRILDDTQKEAYTDAISGLPNMKAAMRNLQKALEYGKAKQKPYSILLIDGDDIRIYNSINYAAGDDMIRDMSAVFISNLRPSDFVARWRTGDEFIVILPNTPIEDARVIGERFRLAVIDASRAWRFPVTISIGIASYPMHGDNVNALIDKAESANKNAKDRGKDKVVLAE